MSINGANFGVCGADSKIDRPGGKQVESNRHDNGEQGNRTGNFEDRRSKISNQYKDSCNQHMYS